MGGGSDSGFRKAGHGTRDYIMRTEEGQHYFLLLVDTVHVLTRMSFSLLHRMCVSCLFMYPV